MTGEVDKSGGGKRKCQERMALTLATTLEQWQKQRGRDSLILASGRKQNGDNNMTTLSVFVQRRPNFRNRGYSPGIARFLKQSPLAFDGGDANLYRYVQNDPINAVDSTGLVVTVAGKPVDQNSDVYQGWLTNPVYKEILDKLGASKRTINFTSMNDLELELKVRQAFINCMKKICKVDYGMYGPELPFSCGFGAICTPGWINGQYRGPSPSDALDRLMANPGKSFD